ncbi:MqnA/MqnD/SBP family protein, partial [Nitratidesulfovibrio oxamicus]|uniref:MqnA/MqnD/SBP family protein n=1 Tax=Nitratidesulfovibrio oxamicus TaxID=32016 RepID=UPI0027DCCCB4
MSSQTPHTPADTQSTSSTPSRNLSLGISPCPNDTYIFHALAKGCIPLPCGFDLFMADVEVLNGRAREGSLDVTKLSLAAMAHVLDDYVLLNAGAALGRGCGPLLVAREPLSPAELA